MFDNIKNLAGLMGQMGEMRARAEKMQEELGRRTVEGDAGAGAVRVVMNGRMEVLSVRLDRPMLASLAADGDNSGGNSGGNFGGEADQRVIEDLIAAAFNDASMKARDLMQEEMSKATGGLNIPGLDKMLGR